MIHLNTYLWQSIALQENKHIVYVSGIPHWFLLLERADFALEVNYFLLWYLFEIEIY